MVKWVGFLAGFACSCYKEVDLLGKKLFVHFGCFTYVIWLWLKKIRFFNKMFPKTLVGPRAGAGAGFIPKM